MIVLKILGSSYSFIEKVDSKMIFDCQECIGQKYPLCKS